MNGNGKIKRKSKYERCPELREKLLDLLVSPRGSWMTRRALAEHFGVHMSTIVHHLTPALREEVAARKVKMSTAEGALAAVDSAMLALAQQGNGAAARLIYARQQQAAPNEPLPSVSELEEMVRKLRDAQAVPD